MRPATQTRFKIYVQSPVLGPPFDQPQVIAVNRAPAQIAPGPSDVDTGTGEPLLYVLDAKKKRYDNLTPHHFNEFDGRPWGGASFPSAKPGADGHFDYLDPHTHPRQFAQAAAYGSVRFTLERWQAYLNKAGQTAFRWHHRPQAPGINHSLELNPCSSGTNARAGYGFLEFGHGPRPSEAPFARQPLWQNFDLIAHEFGHSLLFSLLGFPANMSKDTPWYSDDNKRINGNFLAFHESAGDLVAMIASLHHDTVIDHLLKQTGGDLRTGANVLSEVGEFDKDDLGKLHCIRNAANTLTLDKVSIENDGPHKYSLPLTGAIYNLFVDEYDNNCTLLGDRDALKKARDYLGELLARTWKRRRLPSSNLDFLKVREALVKADREMGGQHERAIVSNFNERGIA